jgi:hypothetical protein
LKALRRGAFLALVLAVPWIQGRIDSRAGAFRATEESLYLWSGRHVRLLAPGFEGLAADLYWLRTVQYFGSQRVFGTGKRFDLLLPLIDITTSLDPRMEIAYRYGAIFLSEPAPMGAGRPKDGVAILERGVRHLPDSWRLRQDLGYFHFLFLNDPKRAAEILLEASKLPGAAFWLRTLAADILTRGGERSTSRRIWVSLYASSEGSIKENARVHLQQLDAVDRSEALSAAVAAFERAAGHRPSSLSELPAANLRGLALTDPTGVPFRYDSATGRVSIAPQSPLWRPEP